ncbi:MAG: hypothetical protein HY702_01510 [Gemmatimonadetes bacterium]|nr:hypothetical protein [Gemmatimonadota bacterium]
MTRAGPDPGTVAPRVHGRLVDAHTRCVHYDGPRDIVAIKFRCCGRYYACYSCHEELESHPAARWARGEFGERAVLCGACGAELTINAYLACGYRCPSCGAGFNPGCARHHPLYFET